MGVWENQERQARQRKQNWLREQKFNFVETLSNSANEEEVKSAFIREFNLPINMKENHDLLVEKILFEFKYSANLSDVGTTARIVAQAIFYIRRLYENCRIGEVQHLAVIDKDEARIFRVSEFRVFYESNDYKWRDFRPSSPDPTLVSALKYSGIIESNRVYDLTSENDLHIFSSYIYRVLIPNKVNKKASRKFYLGNLFFNKISTLFLIISVFCFLIFVSRHQDFSNSSDQLIPVQGGLSK